MEKIILQAIATKKLIEFSYDGHPRRIEPHILGVNRGVTQVLGYQVGGSSSSGSIPEPLAKGCLRAGFSALEWQNGRCGRPFLA